MKRYICFCWLFSCAFLPIFAQTTAGQASSAEVVDEALAVVELANVADSLGMVDGLPLVKIEHSQLDLDLVEWSLQWLDTTQCTMEHDTTRLSDAEYIARLQALPNEIGLPYNDVVKTFIEMYVIRRPRQLASLIRLSEMYFPIFEDKLAQHGLPYELKYLAVIESALNASARSRAGAGGLWQFMPATGRLYGLEVNSLVDERLDPYKSTDAACRYLKTLYNLLGDWHLALAAYNCGPGNVNKAIQRAGGKRDFWSIYPWLPRETRSYVPIFIAANYAMNYADQHGICPDTLFVGNKLKQKDMLMPMLVDTVHSDKRQHLKQTSEVLGLPLSEIRKLNPAYIKDVLPGGKSYPLVLPVDYIAPYLALQDTILAHKADSLIYSQKTVIDMAQKTASDGTYTSGGVTYYKVKKGDTLGAIARRYRCSVSQLQRWNGISGTNIRIGQKLKIKK
ncbi:MAG: transglycosylase SLT domain-containing protein [Paludibacteraceae bacterium]|nr:transglycosylase SLT domain-containing protein [Paludibacteraceae bacterium]